MIIFLFFLALVYACLIFPTSSPLIPASTPRVTENTLTELKIFYFTASKFDSLASIKGLLNSASWSLVLLSPLNVQKTHTVPFAEKVSWTHSFPSPHPSRKASPPLVKAFPMWLFLLTLPWGLALF